MFPADGPQIPAQEVPLSRVRYEFDLASWIGSGLNIEAAHDLAMIALKVRVSQ